MSMIKKALKKSYAYYESRHNHTIYKNQFKRYCKNLGIPNKKADGEDAYITKWKVFGRPVEPYSYRLFSRYMGPDPNIIPEDIGRTFIETALNQPRHTEHYSDKNIYDSIFKDGTTPKTILRRMNGSVLIGEDYQPIKNSIGGVSCGFERLILKPSAGTQSGIGVTLFERKGDAYFTKNGQKLSEEFLESYGTDFILQEAVKQHPLISKLNPSSVNTLRLTLYRSVKDESLNITSATIRIGKNGAICDNAHAGGNVAGINLKTGRLNNYVCDQYGNKFSEWNGIDYTKREIIIPNWDRVLEFAKYIGNEVHHCRLLALDIALREDGTPVLIEYNVIGYGYWVFMFAGQNPFGDFTDEIIEYALKQKNKIKFCVNV